MAAASVAVLPTHGRLANYISRPGDQSFGPALNSGETRTFDAACERNGIGREEEWIQAFRHMPAAIRPEQIQSFSARLTATTLEDDLNKKKEQNKNRFQGEKEDD